MKTPIVIKLAILIAIPFIGVFFFSQQSLAFGECTNYGLHSYYDAFTNSCKCYAGYAFKDSYFGSTCVSLDTLCQDDYGYGAEYNSLYGSCQCRYGYQFDTNLFGDKECVLNSTYCSNHYGFHSTYDSLTRSCGCSYGYVMYGGTCTYGETACHEQFGSHSSYSGLSETCSCDDGYTFNEDNVCVEKQNNVYFILDEVDTTAREAIIHSEFSKQYYKISYGLGCYSWSITDYVNDQIVVNLGTDFDVDRWDRIVLQDDDEVCDITSVSKVSSSETLSEPVSSLQCSFGTVNYGGLCISYEAGCAISFGQNVSWSGSFNSDGIYTCLCNSGYAWSSDGTSCVSTPSTPSYMPPITTTDGGEYDSNKKDQSLIDRLRGTILLQTEEHGEAWYINPTDGNRYYMKDGSTAYSMMRSFGLGITDSDLGRIPSVNNTDEMNASKSDCSTNSLANSVKGKILLQVEQRGEAWYVHPEKCRSIYMKDGAAAYTIMRFLGLGITNEDLTKLPSNELN